MNQKFKVYCERDDDSVKLNAKDIEELLNDELAGYWRVEEIVED